MTTTVLNVLCGVFYCYAGFCLISLIVCSHSFCSQRPTVRDEVSVMWGLCCFPYCKTWDILQLLFSVTLAKALISLCRCAAYLVLVLWVVFCYTGFLISSPAVNQRGGDCISQQGLEGRTHIMWISTGYQRTSALQGCLQSSDFRT